MRSLNIKLSIISVAMVLMPLISNAANVNQDNEAFKTSCVKNWMQRTVNPADKLEFTNFGAEYCDCIAVKPYINKEGLGKSAQICLSQTLIHDVVDTLEGKEEAANITLDKINKTCQDKWQLVYSKMADKTKQEVSKYCECTSSKLDPLMQSQAKAEDKKYDDKIDSIADGCAISVEADHGVLEIKR
jgi:hypothetical protein